MTGPLHINHGDVSMDLELAASARPRTALADLRRRHMLARMIGQQMGYACQMVQGKQPR
jgi:hypothetical protein